MNRKRIPVETLSDHVGESVTVSGWLYNRRSKGKIQFLQVRDGSGIVQAVMGKQDVSEETFSRSEGLPSETSLSVTGSVRADRRAPGGVELIVAELEVHHVPTQEYPISKQAHGADFLLSHRHLWLRLLLLCKLLHPPLRRRPLHERRR